MFFDPIFNFFLDFFNFSNGFGSDSFEMWYLLRCMLILFTFFQAKTVAAFARLTVEDSKKILPAGFYPTWVVFSERQKLSLTSFFFYMLEFSLFLSVSDMYMFAWVHAYIYVLILDFIRALTLISLLIAVNLA